MVLPYYTEAIFVESMEHRKCMEHKYSKEQRNTGFWKEDELLREVKANGETT